MEEKPHDAPFVQNGHLPPPSCQWAGEETGPDMGNKQQSLPPRSLSCSGKGGGKRRQEGTEKARAVCHLLQNHRVTSQIPGWHGIPGSATVTLPFPPQFKTALRKKEVTVMVIRREALSAILVPLHRFHLQICYFTHWIFNKYLSLRFCSR